ncbi:MAG: helix-turn-helix transcriptional regulator [Firmicutes bacterium]|nr:helix-turn-helix transcriptional regulator [Bacillota bacterium]
MRNGNILREIRLRRGISQVALAARAGTTPAMISIIERYGHLPRPDLRRRIAEALGVAEADIWPEVADDRAGRA